MTDRSPDYFKPCAKCQEVLPLTSYTFHNGYWDGLEGTCKACRKVLKIKFTPIQQEQFRLDNYPTKTKKCSDCNYFLPLTDFCKKLKYRDGLSYICRLCELAKNSKFKPVGQPPSQSGDTHTSTEGAEITPIKKKKRIIFSL